MREVDAQYNGCNLYRATRDYTSRNTAHFVIRNFEEMPKHCDVLNCPNASIFLNTTPIYNLISST